MMKIRTQLIFTLCLFGLLLIGMAASLIITNHQVDQLRRQEEIAYRIEQGANLLSHLSGDYLMYRESQQRARWEASFDSFSADIARLMPNNPEQETIVTHIKADQARLQAIFRDVVSTLEESARTSGGAPDAAFNQVSWSRMQIQSRSIAFGSSLLAEQLRDQTDRVRQMSLVLLFILIGIFGAYLLVNYYLIYRRTLKALAELHAGTEIIGSGNLDFAITVRQMDEIGELACAFNQMTASLKEATASKVDLEREATERKQAEEALRQNEALLQAVLDNVPAAIYLKDRDSRLLLANPATLAVIGKPAAAVLGKTDAEFYADPATGRAIMENDRRIMDSGHTEVVEESVVDPGGTRVYLSTKAPYRDADGQVIGLIGVAREITERKQMEAALRENQSRLESLFSAIPNPILEYDTHGRPVRANNAVLNAIGLDSLNFTRDQAVEKLNLRSLGGSKIPTKDLPVSRALRGERVSGDLYAVTTADGVERIISIHAAPLYEEADHISGAVVLWHDITELKNVEEALQLANEELAVTTEELRQQNDELLQAQSALRESEARYRNLVEHAPVGIYEIDLIGQKFLSVNDVLCSVTGYSRAELLSMNALELLEDEHKKIFLDRVQRMMSGQDVPETVEYQIRMKSGELRWALLSVNFTRRDGILVRARVIATDITERKQVEQRILVRTNELQAANEELRAARLAALNLMEDALNAQEQVKEVNLRLRESEQRLNRAQEIAHLGSWELDLVNDQLAWSDEVYRIFGLQPQEFAATYEAFLEAVHPDDRAAVDAAYSGSVREGRDQYEIEHRIVRHSSGEIRVVHEKCEHFRDETGRIIRSTGMVHDITERKRAEEALRRNEALLSQTGEMAKIGGWELDVPTMRLLWSPETYRIHEVDFAFQPTVESAINFYAPEVQSIISEAASRAINQGQFYDLELPFITATGKQLWIRTMGQPEFQGGKCVRLFGAFQDITERKQAEEALRRAHDELELRVQERTKELAIKNKELVKEIAERKEVERQLRIQTTAMEAAANGIIITDPQGCIQWINPALLQITGYEGGELVGQNMRIFNSGKHDLDYYHRMWATILSGLVWHGEVTNRRKDGSLYVEEQTITPVRDENNQIQQFIAIKQDITERKRAEAELAEWNVRLQALSLAEREQRQFSDSLAEAALVLNQSMKLEEVLPLILEQVKVVIPYQLAMVTMFDGELFYDACHEGDQRWSQSLPQATNRFPIANFPLLVKVRHSRQPVLVSDIQEEQNWMVVPGLEWSRSYLCVPLLAENEVIGFLNLFADKPNFFTTEMQDRLVAFASHAAVAIQNAWLFEQVRASSERLQSLSRRLVEIQENERLYIARELHDEAGQMLTALMLDLVTLETQADQPEAVLKKVAEMEQSLSAVSENLHSVAMALRPASLDHLGLVPALRQYLESIGERYKLKVSFRSGNFQERLPADMETELYRIVQEALTNVARHAQASQVDVILTVRESKLIVMVEDDGNGFDPEKVSDDGHLGLFGMRERAEMIGGQLVIESKPGKGTTVMVEVNYDSPIIDRR